MCLGAAEQLFAAVAWQPSPRAPSLRRADEIWPVVISCWDTDISYPLPGLPICCGSSQLSTSVLNHLDLQRPSHHNRPRQSVPLPHARRDNVTVGTTCIAGLAPSTSQLQFPAQAHGMPRHPRSDLRRDLPRGPRWVNTRCRIALNVTRRSP